MKNKSSLVRFDWAIKRLLRQKSNFVVLEGLLSISVKRMIIVRILESEGNKEDSEDKFNRVDVLAENSKGELVIIEVQQPGARLFSPYAIWHIQGSHRVYS